MKRRLKKIVPSALHPYLGAVRRRVAANPLRIGFQHGRLLNNGELNERERELLRQVNKRIHHRDGMYAGDGAAYFRIGLSALECVDAVLASAGQPKIQNMLDLPCGYGRVLRFLVKRFPDAHFVACEIQNNAADFCAAAFGATAFYSQPDVREVTFPSKFDLIWCGSLVTHLSRTDTRNLLDLFSRHLSADGVAIITTHGTFVAEQMSAGATYDLPSVAIARLLESYKTTGYGYHDYSQGEGYFDFHPEETGYGVSLSSPESIRALAADVGLKQVYFKPRGWAEHQDVFGFVRS